MMLLLSDQQLNWLLFPTRSASPGIRLVLTRFLSVHSQCSCSGNLGRRHVVTVPCHWLLWLHQQMFPAVVVQLYSCLTGILSKAVVTGDGSVLSAVGLELWVKPGVLF